jgi:hypothetical protein
MVNQFSSIVGINAAISLNGDATTKLAHDRYDVYVNDDFVGQKPLLNQSEDITDVSDFLKSQGFNSFQALVDGDHYKIEPTDSNTERKMKEALSIYLQTR